MLGKTLKRCQARENIETFSSAEKCADVFKRVKPGKRCKARENIQTLLNEEKYADVTKRGKHANVG